MFDQMRRYGVASMASAAITFGVPILLHEIFGLDEDISVAFGPATAFLVNFLTVRIYVFRSTGKPAHELAQFAASSVVFRLSEYAAFWFIHNYFEVFYLLALAVVIVVSMALKFLFYRRFVFKPQV